MVQYHNDTTIFHCFLLKLLLYLLLVGLCLGDKNLKTKHFQNITLQNP